MQNVWSRLGGFEDFKGGYALYAFDLTADLCNDVHLNLIKTGNLRMVLNFASDTAVNIVCVVYMEYQNLNENLKKLDGSY